MSRVSQIMGNAYSASFFIALGYLRMNSRANFDKAVDAARAFMRKYPNAMKKLAE